MRLVSLTRRRDGLRSSASSLCRGQRHHPLHLGTLADLTPRRRQQRVVQHLPDLRTSSASPLPTPLILTVFTSTISMSLLTSAGMSGTCLRFAKGSSTRRMPPRYAPSTLSLMAPTGSTCPRSEISPVIAVSWRTGRPVKRLAMAVAMETPAEGPWREVR